MLRQHKHIADAAVVGVRSEDNHTEVPKAFIVRKSEPEAQSLQSHEVYSFARDRLASFKALDGGIVFVDHIPRSSTGKVQRFKLKLIVGQDSSVANGDPPVEIAAFADKEDVGEIATLKNGQMVVNGQVSTNGIAMKSERLGNGENAAEYDD